MNPAIGISSLRSIVAKATPPLPSDNSDYRIAARLGPTFLARGRLGLVALLVPLAGAAGAIGRSGGGFALRSALHVQFDHEGRCWEQPAAILDCTDEQVADTFLVLVADLANRLGSSSADITWAKILAWVEEWQMLLGRRTILSPEAQLGLWGELSVMSWATDADALFAAWRGPEGEPVDFFHDGVALEVKVSRHRHLHHVSQGQVTDPRGDHSGYLLSMWVGVEPVRGVSLGEIVEQLIGRLADSAAFLKHLARIGYLPRDQKEYAARFLLLEAPLWFRINDVPQVRLADVGVSQLRYSVTLDVDFSLEDARTWELCRHFCGVRYPVDESRTGVM